MKTVYFVADRDRRYVKIGTTDDIVARFKALSKMQAIPDSIVLLKTFPGGKTLERAIHDRFKLLRSHGEWFKLESPLKEWLELEAIEMLKLVLNTE